MSAPIPPGPPPNLPPGRSNTLAIVLGVVGGVVLLTCGGLCAGCLLIARTTDRLVRQEEEGVLQEINERRVAMEQELVPAAVKAIMAAEKFPAVIDRIGAPLDIGDHHKI